MTVLLEARDLKVRYNRVPALHGVSLQVRAGEISAVIGPNGAGKTSLVNALAGLIPSSGSIAFPQWPHAARSVEARVLAGVCIVPETRDLFGPMTVEDNLRLGAYSIRHRRDIDTSHRLGEIFAIFPRLADRQMQLAQTLSGGERQMLALGRALMLKPRLLMLDEPSLGLAPLVVAEIFRVIERLRSEGAAVLLIEQNARAALKIADYAYVLENGSLELEGPAAEIGTDPRIIETYFGLGPTPGETHDRDLGTPLARTACPPTSPAYAEPV